MLPGLCTSRTTIPRGHTFAGLTTAGLPGTCGHPASRRRCYLVTRQCAVFEHRAESYTPGYRRFIPLAIRTSARALKKMLWRHRDRTPE